ncbi:hypothetical protein BCR44DRAFT_1440951, partial [Catenaria anguillulae PL171]
MALHREERYVICLPRDDGLLMGRYGTIEPNVQLFPFPDLAEAADPSDMDTHAHWKHHFLHSLAISQQKGDHPVLLLTPAAFSKRTNSSPPNSAVAALLGANVTTGIVVDVGYRHTEIVPVSECTVLRTDQVLVPYGMIDAVADLRANPPTADLSPAHTKVLNALLTLSNHQLATSFHGLWSSSYAASIPDYTLTVHSDQAPASRKRDKQQQQQQPTTQDHRNLPPPRRVCTDLAHRPKISNDRFARHLGCPCHSAATVTVTDATGTLTLAIPGAVRQLLAPFLTTPLIDGLIRCLDSLGTTDASLRPTLADNLVLTGLGAVMIDCLSDRIEVEAPLVSRYLFSDARGFVTRDDYERLGPGVVHARTMVALRFKR